MRASYYSIDNKLKQKMCGKVNKDITFIQFFHSTPLNYSKYSSCCYPYNCFFAKSYLAEKKMASEYPQRVLVSQPIRTCLKVVFVLR